MHISSSPISSKKKLSMMPVTKIFCVEIVIYENFQGNFPDLYNTVLIASNELCNSLL